MEQTDLRISEEDCSSKLEKTRLSSDLCSYNTWHETKLTSDNLPPLFQFSSIQPVCFFPDWWLQSAVNPAASGTQGRVSASLCWRGEEDRTQRMSPLLYHWILRMERLTFINQSPCAECPPFCHPKSFCIYGLAIASAGMWSGEALVSVRNCLVPGDTLVLGGRGISVRCPCKGAFRGEAGKKPAPNCLLAHPCPPSTLGQD